MAPKCTKQGKPCQCSVGSGDVHKTVCAPLSPASINVFLTSHHALLATFLLVCPTQRMMITLDISPVSYFIYGLNNGHLTKLNFEAIFNITERNMSNLIPKPFDNICTNIVVGRKITPNTLLLL